jgi:hypothetical protein
MRTIGIDLALTSAHKAIVADDQGRFLTPVFTFHTMPADLERVLARAREAAPDTPLQAVMEPTGMAWFPIAVFFARQACKQLDRLDGQIVALKNRIEAIDRFAWPGLEQQVFPAPFAPAARWFRQHWYDPRVVVQTGAEAIESSWQASTLDSADDGRWARQVVQLASEVLALYGEDSPYLDFAELQAEILRDQDLLDRLEQLHHQVRMEVVRPLYRQIHPSRALETLKGVGQDGAAVFASFVGEVERFGSVREFRGWSGLVPASAQSGGSEAKGQHITQAGPDLVKKYAFLDAESARQWDPQLAAIYYTQMVQRGKHHNQAVCACATHLLDRVLAVLRTDQPYELRDVDGTPVSVAEARAIILERYQVPAEVRRRTTRRQRHQQKDRRAEHTYARESRLR